ncbi:TonB-dependent siderophore receptor [Methylosinus sp. PW1]|uniref:TonB-dependent receptor n=1 Tax=Methylosinus sp. PW1 TaxID=107636 RepID=UPI0005614922|nr:TonB-dependent receptor [Methylosinus sp. PW1]
MISVFALPASALCEEATEEARVGVAQMRPGEKKEKDDAPKAKSLGKDVAGVFVNASVSDSGYSPGFVMRGFPGGLTLFDGAAHGFTSQEVNLSTVDHVEFYKGPSAMLFGRALGGYGGSANYIRKAPTTETFARGTATIGAYDVYRTTFDVNAPLNDAQRLLFRMTGFAQSVGSFVDYVRTRGFLIAPTGTLILDNGDKATLRAEYSASRLVYRDGAPAAPIFLHAPRSFYAGAPVYEHETPNAADFTFTYEHAFDADWSLTSVVDYSLNGNEYGWFQGWGYDGLHSVTLGRPVQTHQASRSFDAQLRLNGRFMTGDIGHAVFLGLEHWDYFYGHDEKFARDKLPNIDIGAPIYPVGVDFSGAQWANGAARAWSRSVYAQDLVDLSPQWRILLGGRYDLLAQRETVFDPFGALSGASSSTLGKGTRGYFSPRAGILYRPDEQTHLFVAYGRSLIPNISVRVRGGDAPPPQQDTQYEIGFERRFPEYKARFEVGLFDVTRDHVAIADPADPGGFYALVTGRQHSHGVEFNLSGEILPGLQASGAATFLHAVVAKDSNVPSQAGSDLLGAPRRVFSVSLDYKPEWDALRGLELGASYYYASAAEATLPNVHGFTLAPQQMLGASLGYRFDEHWKLDVSASNLTDRPNFTSGGALFRGEPRSISATLSFKY